MRLLGLFVTIFALAGAPCVAGDTALSGSVRYADGRPAGGAVVYALDGRQRFKVWNNTVMGGEALPRALADREGAFELDVDAANITALFAQDMNDACGIARITDAGGPVAVTIDAPARGVVRVANGPNPAPGEDILLSRRDPETGLYLAYGGKSNAEGVFTLPALTPGGYEVSTSQDVPQVGCCFRSVVTRMAKVDVAPGSRPEITLGGTDLPAVSGRIASAGGQPLHGVWVRLIPKSGPAGVVHSAVTDRDGSYRVYDVPPGDYEVRCFRRLALNDGARTLEALATLAVAKGAREATCDVAVDLSPFLPLEIGQPAPAIDGTTLEGQPFDWAALRGHYVVVHFYAGWCQPCVKTIGSYDALAPALGNDERVRVVGISLDETEQEARDFAREKNIAHPVVYAGSWAENPVRKSYRVVNVPTTAIVGPDGTIVQLDLHGQVLVDYLREKLAGAS